MHILLSIPTLSKIGGGTVAVVQSLSEQLALLCDSVTVLAFEVDKGVSEALPRNDRVKVIHISASAGRGLGGDLRKQLLQRLAPKTYDLVHNFGLWQPFNHAVASACYQLDIPVVSSPSGMLAPWALRHKSWKKRLGWWVYQRRDLFRTGLLAATSSQEVLNIHSKVTGKSIALIPNGVEIPIAIEKPTKHAGDQQRKAVFLGRIHSVKGLKNLVEAWNRVRPSGWSCVMAGPDEAGHQQELTKLLQAYNLVNLFEFPGLVEGPQKWDLLKSANLFVLPSFTENFGISAAEALACQIPVITTKGTPWKDLVDHRCGWWVDIGVEPLADALHQAISLSDDQRREMGQRGRKLVEAKYSWDLIARKTLSAYNWVLGRGPKPDCIVCP